MKKLTFIILTTAFLVGPSCKKPLDELVYSQLGPNNFYQNAEDAESLLNAAYVNSMSYRDQVRDWITFGETNTDILIERNGAINAQIKPVEDFTLDASHPWLVQMWQRFYGAIFRCNLILDRVPAIDMDANRKTVILAEARFLRGLNYYFLYDLFGPVPLILSSETNVQDRPTRATKEEMVNYFETDFTAAANDLPVTQSQFPRATKGAALGFLCKFQLNDKNWTAAAASAQQVISSNAYQLFYGDRRADLFELENEGNSEFILVAPFVAATSAVGNSYLSHAVPPKWPWKYPPHVDFAADFKLLSAWVNTFDPADQRLDAIVRTYTNTDGVLITLGVDDARSMKYPEEPTQFGDVTAIDFPYLRYPDILLARAEALNELNGPTQEAVDLVNEVRDAARLPGYGLGDVGDKDQFRDLILAERGWEFHTEGLRRQDLIRHGKFIQWAVNRGKPAQPHHVLFPIPQREIDANPALEQNEGY